MPSLHGKLNHTLKGAEMNKNEMNERIDDSSPATCSVGYKVQCSWCKNVTEFDRPDDVVECIHCGYEIMISENILKPNR